MNRKQFINLSLTGGAAVMQPFPLLQPGSQEKNIKAIAFDAFPIFDPGPIGAMVEKLYPGKGAALNNGWRSKLFEYTWLYATAEQYRNFYQIAEDALKYAAAQNGCELSTDNKDQLLQQYLQLPLWPDVLPALERLKQAKIRLGFLSNFTEEMLRSCLGHSQVEDYFEHIISTDRVKTYKPHPRAYQVGMDVLKLKKDEILFAAFASWDASGSKWFGYPTFWVNRAEQRIEELHILPDETGKGLTALAEYAIKKAG